MSPPTPVGIVAGTALGRALAHRLTEDGRTVHLAPPDAPAGAARARLIVIDAEPSALRRIARALGDATDGDRLLAHAVRGLTEGAAPTEVLREETPARRIGVLAGPLTVADLEAGRPTAAVIASRHPEVVDEFSAALSTPRLRVFRGRDPLGVELASGLADVIAVGCGLAAGLELGEPARAVLMTRAVRELGRLIAARGGDPQTATGLAGLGDLLVRAVDPTSETFRYGRALARGESPAPEGRLAEVIASARRYRALAARHHTRAHVLDGIALLLEGGVAASDLVKGLMTLPVLDD